MDLKLTNFIDNSEVTTFISEQFYNDPVHPMFVRCYMGRTDFRDSYVNIGGRNHNRHSAELNAHYWRVMRSEVERRLAAGLEPFDMVEWAEECEYARAQAELEEV